MKMFIVIDDDLVYSVKIGILSGRMCISVGWQIQKLFIYAQHIIQGTGKRIDVTETSKKERT